jgi:hypothetical protein
MAIPSADIEQPAEHANAKHAMKKTLARRNAEPLARHASHNSGGGHCNHEATCYPGHTHRIPRRGCPWNSGSRPEEEPEHSYIHGGEEQVAEAEPDTLKKSVQGIYFRRRFSAHKTSKLTVGLRRTTTNPGRQPACQQPTSLNLYGTTHRLVSSKA